MERQMEFKALKGGRLSRLPTSSKIFTISIGSYLLAGYLFARKHDDLKYRVSLSRIMSRYTGHLCNMPLPPYLRKWVFLAFSKVYGVNLQDIKETDLNNFRTFNQFFTRELAPGAREISDLGDVSSVCSPCDGTVLSYGQVKGIDCTIEGVKGSDYRLEEFLFGYNTVKEDEYRDERVTMVERIVDSVKDRGNKVMYVIIYLAPQDYHRYHSPCFFTANYRRHIAGFLEPVMPAYLKKHKNVLKENERVNLLGDWKNGFFAISFVGALNVGSI